MPHSMPKQKPGKSKQDYGTPPEFLAAAKKRLCIEDFSIDLAASPENAVTSRFYTEEHNSLKQNWNVRTGWWAWLNPPFGDITPWAKKAVYESHNNGAHIAMLVPLSISEWWVSEVEPWAYIAQLQGRIKFVGADQGYPKDCALILYTPWGFRGTEIWDWRRDVPKLQQPQPSQDQGVYSVSEVRI